MCEGESVAHLEPRWWMNSADDADDLELNFHPLLLVTFIVIVARERLQRLLLCEPLSLTTSAFYSSCEVGC